MKDLKITVSKLMELLISNLHLKCFLLIEKKKRESMIPYDARIKKIKLFLWLVFCFVSVIY